MPGRRCLPRTLPAAMASMLLLAWGPLWSAAAEPAVSFVNDVVPVLTKAGCNAGVCHAKAGGGQNGFQLSLLGFEPFEDYEHLVREVRGRRVFLAGPDQSLVLRKASGRLPHGGGVRLPESSAGYAILREWIRQGALLDSDGPKLVGFEVEPRRLVLQPGQSQQLRAVAHFSDGAVRDVTGQGAL